MKSALSRGILVLHRYTGVLVGVLMTVWCLSGFVMMYQEMPGVTEEEALASLAPVDLSAPLALDALPFADTDEIGGFRIDMLEGRPVLRLGGGRGGRGGGRRGGGGPAGNFDLISGTELAELTPQQLADVARRFAAAKGITPAAELRPVLMQEQDQWTLQAFRSAQPLYRVDLGDAADTVVYVSAASGSVAMDTNRNERILAWLGAIPHWLYPTVLRQDGELWSQIVIWTSVIGTFLTITGLYVGIGRISRRKGRISPYKGLWYWHHMVGLVFGILTMTWVFSGLMTMSPWGLLEGPPNSYRQDIAGKATWADVRGFIEQAGHQGLPDGTAQLRPAVLGGRLHVLAHAPAADPLRLGADARPAPLQRAEVDAALANALGSMPRGETELFTGEDAYHYGFKDRQAQPAYRVMLQDDQQTRIYLNAATGEVGRVVDDAARQSRWLRNGLHSLDFIPGRPLWDVITIVLLIGVTLVCATGAWMSFRRVGRDVKMLRRRLRRKLSGDPPRRAPVARPEQQA
ncbi:peptidase [Altererythrobacter xixiisoli]|uniref:Peptidase n=1 Tax=Croceibacterium xixiisoli TaxID=1476466 RepID=A0A6I4TYC7_9SPHN|nr:PepSY domain-containing protein [Croceibacterium xixiisoli]MXP00100.1 peptidase [Croceibacterium xixiisoli]